MVKLVKQESSLVEEKFEGGQGQLWKSGSKGTATMFVSWVSNVIKANSNNVSAMKTRREYVTQENGYETLNISYGRKDTLPLDIRVSVPQTGKSLINLKYRKEPKAAIWTERNFSIKNPMSLSVDPITKKLISVVFTGPQFSFAGQGRKLINIPGYEDALSEIERPIIEAAKILDKFDSEMYKSRNLVDFDSTPELQELKEMYSDWEMDVDASKLASSNKVTYIFNHPTDPDYNFTVYFQDEGGSEYKIYATYRNQEMSLAKLAKLLEKERERLADQKDKYSDYANEFESRKLAKEMKVSGASSISMLDDPKKLDAFVKKIGDALEDFSLARWANIDITQNADGSEDWDLILTTQHTLKSNSPAGIISWRIEPNLPLQFYQKDKDIHGEPTTKVTYKGKIAATDMKTNFGYTPSIRDVELNSPAFFKEITNAAEKFLADFGAYNRQLATISDIDNQIIGGKDWIVSYDKPDYNLANWADRTLGKIEPELEKLQETYNLSLEKKVEEIETDDYVDFLAQYGVVGDNPQADAARDMSGKLVFTGSYVDKSFTDHLLEVRVNFDRGDKFVVWIRPDLKGSANTKAEGQSDLSFLEKWAKDNVALRTAQKTSDNFRQAISQELINLGAIEGHVKGTFDISTSKIKGITIDLKVTNNQILVNAYRDGKIVDKITIDIAPFAENPVKVAKNILNLLSKHIKESYPSIDRQMPNLNRYWDALFDKLKVESGIQKQSNLNTHYLQVGSKRCKVEFGPLGQVKLTTLFGKEVVEEQFNADPRYFIEDKEKMQNLLNEYRARF